MLSGIALTHRYALQGMNASTEGCTMFTSRFYNGELLQRLEVYHDSPVFGHGRYHVGLCRWKCSVLKKRNRGVPADVQDWLPEAQRRGMQTSLRLCAFLFPVRNHVIVALFPSQRTKACCTSEIGVRRHPIHGYETEAQALAVLWSLVWNPHNACASRGE